jgi:hypothetical protein
MGQRSAVGVVALPLLIGACGGASTPPAPSALAAEAGSPPFADLDDAGLPWEGPYPASHPPLPTITYNGGSVLEHPEVVSVDFEGDDLDDTIQALSRNVGATQWWQSVKEGYCDSLGRCIEDLTFRRHVSLPALSKAEHVTGFVDSVTTQISQLKRYIRTQIDAGLIPEPSPETVVMFYLPLGVPIGVNELQGCQAGGFSGYHDSMTRNEDGSGIEFPYALLARCSRDPAYLQRTASHELIEAATDPFRDNGGYVILDLVWSLLEGGEVGDMCVDVGTQHDTVVENGLTLQRSWSNVAVARGGNPCVPVPPGEVYFNAAPAETSLSLANGESVQIELDAFSDGQVDDWTMYAVDFGSAVGAYDPYLSLALDRKTANNGTKLVLTVTAIRAVPRSFVGAPFLIVSQTDTHTHVWPGVVFGH